jgi:small subunit ribosomal protein S18
MAKKPPPRSKKSDAGRRTKKKVSVLTTDKIDYIDYKDVNLLKRFVSDRAKVRARRVTGNDTQQQSEVARAIKNAREMALLPYTTRVTTQRNSRDRGRDRDRGPRDDAPRDDAPRGNSPAGEDVDETPGMDAVTSTETTDADVLEATEEV